MSGTLRVILADWSRCSLPTAFNGAPRSTSLLTFVLGNVLVAVLALLASSSARAQECSVEQLHRALLEHDRARIEFRYKMKTGYIRRAKDGDIAMASQRNRALYGGPASTLHAIRSHLKAVDQRGRAYALVYEPKPAGCVWLIGPEPQSDVIGSSSRWDGLTASHLRDRLDVTVRSATRLPTLRTADEPSRRAAIAPSPPPSNGVLSDTMDISQSLIPSRILLEIERHASLLLVLTAGDLSAVPFAAIQTSRTGKSLIDVVVPILLPSVDGLFFWVKAPRIRPGVPAVIVGNPNLENDPVWRFKPIPSAEGEARAVARMIGSTALIGADATAEAVVSSLQSRDVSLIYIATHGIADATNPMDDSYLALSGGHLRAAHIKRLSYPTIHPVVVMSACQTGLGKTFSGGVFGLARAWIHAGASQVLASQWNVDDAATAELMADFMRHAVQGVSVQRAFQKATIATRRRHPDVALWGSFNLFGYPQPEE